MKEVLAEGIELWLGDCREILPSLPKVDAVVTDPPYGIGENNKRNLSRVSAAVPSDYGEFEWDKPIDAELLSMVRTVGRWCVMFGGNFYDAPAASCWLVWDKLNSGDFADCELAWTNLPKAVRRIQWLWNGMIRAEKGKREHPTQKPREVMKWCIEQLPEPNQIILDPFMGSGTTGVAAVKLGRKFIGIEIDPRYYEIAKRRICDVLRQPDLFIRESWQEMWRRPYVPSPQQARLWADEKQ